MDIQQLQPTPGLGAVLQANRDPTPPGLIDRLLLMDKLRQLYQKVSGGSAEPILERLLKELQIDLEVAPADLARIPVTGPAIAVANHPFGMLEGAILGALLPRARQDVKILANYLLAGLPELDGLFLFVDPFGGGGAQAVNSRALRQALAWLKSGGMLVTFPAGEVSHWSLRESKVTDPEWSETVARLVRLTGACVLPIFFEGRNSLPFHLAGFVHPRLRTARLPSELLNKAGKSVEVKIGTSVPARTIVSLASDREATRYLRWRTYLLAHRGRDDMRLVPRILEAVMPRERQEPIAPETPRETVMSDVDRLPAPQCLEESREFSVFLAEAGQIPNLLQELGRLRELSFRKAGEGSGKARDLDNFDPYYQHLFVWNNAKQEVAGAYRLASTHQILMERGIQGLYTSSLFHYNPEFFRRLGPAIELGRSFVRPEYQKQYAPLLLLWKGIVRYVCDHPDTPCLFGPVSISGNYTAASRRLIAAFLERSDTDRELARLVKSRRPFRPAHRLDPDVATLLRWMPGFETLGALVAEMERDGKGIPVLLRHYLKMGGKLAGFNVDPNFSNTLDGLMVVDLRRTDPALLERYMTKEGAAAFLRFHSRHTAYRPAI